MDSRSTTHCSQSSCTTKKTDKLHRRGGVILIVVGLVALAYQGDEAHEPRERRGHWSYSRDDILRETMALPTVAGIAAIRGYSDVAEPVVINPRVCDADSK